MAICKSSELTGRPLDYAVGLATGQALDSLEGFHPSTDPALVLALMNAGPVRLSRYGRRPEALQCVSELERAGDRFVGEGPTLEVAFCRSLVQAEIGPTVEVPDGLL